MQIYMLSKMFHILYCCNSRNGRITLYFFFPANDEHAHKIDREIVCKFLLSWHQIIILEASNLFSESECQQQEVIL